MGYHSLGYVKKLKSMTFYGSVSPKDIKYISENQEVIVRIDLFTITLDNPLRSVCFLYPLLQTVETFSTAATKITTNMAA